MASYRHLTEAEIYDGNGWVNIPALAALGCYMYVIIGARQVGKTFGVLKYLCETDCYHIFMRRTKDELDMICEDSEFNTYLALEKVGIHCDIQKNGSGGWIIGDVDTEDEKRPIINKRGVGMPLSRIAKIRGFSGDRYTDLVFDEFIPEEIVVVRKAEGDAFKNALVTIEGNRYLEGRAPLRVWMLANANNLFSPIMVTMGFTDIVEEMVRKGETSRVYSDGVCIILPKSEDIIEKRKEDPLLNFLSKGSKFSDMAFSNKFSYSDVRLVSTKSVKGWKPLCRVMDFYIWANGNKYYCTTSAHGKGRHYLDNHDDKVKCQLDHPELRLLYPFGAITFSSAAILYNFRKYFDIKQ